MWLKFLIIILSFCLVFKNTSNNALSKKKESTAITLSTNQRRLKHSKQKHLCIHPCRKLKQFKLAANGVELTVNATLCCTIKCF